MDKHTPGPTYNLTTIYVQGNDQEIFEVYADESCEQTLGFVYDEERAQLLAAAPNLLAALEDVELRCTQARIASTIGKEKGRADFLRGELERIAGQARAAIAKAT